MTARDSCPYWVHGSCIYFLDDTWDSTRQRLRPNYSHYLGNGTVSPDLCFGFQIGDQWGTKDVPWRVDGIGDSTGSFLPSECAGGFHIISGHFGSGGRMDMWFEKNVGIVGKRYFHQGTYEQYTKKLRSFAAAQRGIPPQ